MGSGLETPKKPRKKSRMDNLKVPKFQSSTSETQTNTQLASKSMPCVRAASLPYITSPGGSKEITKNLSGKMQLAEKQQTNQYTTELASK